MTKNKSALKIRVCVCAAALATTYAKFEICPFLMTHTSFMQVAKHVRTVCTHQLRDCDFKDVGCQFKVTTYTYYDHSRRLVSYSISHYDC